MIEGVIGEFFSVFLGFLYAPFIYSKILFILVPVVLAIGLMELYFYKYPRESTLHHKSLENTVFLLFIAFDLLRYAFFEEQSKLKIAVALLFGAFSIVIGIMDFCHRLPLSSFFKLSSKTMIAFVSYISIILVYSDMLKKISPEKIVFISLSIALLVLIIFVIKSIFNALEPKSSEEIDIFLKRIEDDMKKNSKILESEEREPEEKANSKSKL